MGLIRATSLKLVNKNAEPLWEALAPYTLCYDCHMSYVGYVVCATYMNLMFWLRLFCAYQRPSVIPIASLSPLVSLPARSNMVPCCLNRYTALCCYNVVHCFGSQSVCVIFS